jgi:hypothetical protein
MTTKKKREFPVCKDCGKRHEDLTDEVSKAADAMLDAVTGLDIIAVHQAIFLIAARISASNLEWSKEKTMQAFNEFWDIINGGDKPETSTLQ